MTYKLSTLLIFVTAAAVFFAHWPSVGRLIRVAVIEMLRLIAWIARTHAVFPWKPVLIVAGTIQLLACSVFFWSIEKGELLDSVLFTVLFGFGWFLGTCLVVGFIHVSYALFQDPFQCRQPVLRGRTGRLTGKTSD